MKYRESVANDCKDNIRVGAYEKREKENTLGRCQKLKIRAFNKDLKKLTETNQ